MGLMMRKNVLLSSILIATTSPAMAITGGSMPPRSASPETILFNAPSSNYDQADQITRFCNGTVFAHKWILTSEHCVLSEPRKAPDGILDCSSETLTGLQTKACSSGLPFIDVGNPKSENGWRKFAVSKMVSSFIDTSNANASVSENKLLTPLHPQYDSVAGENVDSSSLGNSAPRAIAFVELVVDANVAGTGYFAEIEEYDYPFEINSSLELRDSNSDLKNKFYTIAFKDTVTPEESLELGVPTYDPMFDGMYSTYGTSFLPLNTLLDVSLGGEFNLTTGEKVGRGRNNYDFEHDNAVITGGFGAIGHFRGQDANGNYNNASSDFGDGGAAVRRLSNNGVYDIIGVLGGSITMKESELGNGDASVCSDSSTCDSYDLFSFASLRYEPIRNRLLYQVNAVNAPKVIRTTANQINTGKVRLQNLSKGKDKTLFAPWATRDMRSNINANGDVSILSFSDSDGQTGPEACTSVKPFDSCFVEFMTNGNDGSLSIGYPDGNQPFQAILFTSSLDSSYQEGVDGRPIGAPILKPVPDLPFTPSDLKVNEKVEILFNLLDLSIENAPVTPLVGWKATVSFSESLSDENATEDDVESSIAINEEDGEFSSEFSHILTAEDVDNGWVIFEVSFDEAKTLTTSKSLYNRNQEQAYHHTYEDSFKVTKDDDGDGQIPPVEEIPRGTPDSGSLGLGYLSVLFLSIFFRRKKLAN